jgi:hypothetical protein
MAEKSNTCGTTTVKYDESCTYSCICTGAKCSWVVSCKGGVVVSGTGSARIRDPRPGTRPRPGVSVKVDGELGLIAKSLERIWRRPVMVPTGTRRTRITKTVRGKPEQIASALGLRLG